MVEELDASVRRQVLESKRHWYLVQAYDAHVEAQALDAQQPRGPDQRNEKWAAYDEYVAKRDNCLASVARIQEMIDELDDGPASH